MRISLISLHIEETEWQVPFAACRIQAAIDARRFPDLETRIVSMSCAKPDAAIIEEIEKGNPDIAGFSLYLWNRGLVERVARTLRQKHPHLLIITGGPEASANYLQLKDDPVFDLIVTGEGEESVCGIIEGLKAGRSPASLRKSLKTGFIEDLAVLSSPYVNGQIDLSLHKAVLWELSRGCPFHCSFCYESKGKSGVRFFPMDVIRQELELFRKFGIRQVFLLDPTFNFNKERAKEILKLIALSAPDIHFTIEVRAEMIDGEMAELFSDITCSLQIGIQSAVPHVLKNVNRSIDRDLFTENVELLNENFVVYGFDLIYGLPGDSFAGFMESFDFAMSLAPNHLDIFPLSILPGTSLFEDAAGFQMEFENENPYTCLSSPTFPAADMAQAAGIVKTFEQFYNEGKAVSWMSVLLEYLEMSPSEFFTGIQPSGVSAFSSMKDLTVWQIQSVEKILNERNLGEGFAVMEDMINYFSIGHQLRYEQDLDKSAGRIEAACTFHYKLEEFLTHLDEGITGVEDLHFIMEKGRYSYTLFLENEETRFLPATV